MPLKGTHLTRLPSSFRFKKVYSKAAHQLRTSNIQVTPRTHLHLLCFLICLSQILQDAPSEFLSQRSPSLRYHPDEQQEEIDAVPVRLISVLVPRYGEKSPAKEVDGNQEGVGQHIGTYLRRLLHCIQGLACSFEAPEVCSRIFHMLLWRINARLGRAWVMEENTTGLHYGNEPEVENRFCHTGLLLFTVLA